MIEFFPTAPQVDWVSKRWAFFACSMALIALCLGGILTRGFNYGIDFTGGTLVQVTYSAPKTLADLRADLGKAGYEHAEPQSFIGASSFGIRLKGETKMDAETIEVFLKKLREANTASTFRVDRKEYVGPSVGRDLKRRAVWAILGALGAIIIYVGFRFANPLWGAAGVVALAHDVTATAGIFALTGKEVDLVIVAALLTIAGYSINDTIVIFDRMREKMRVLRREPLDAVINASINETLSRTLTTNAMVMTVVVILYFFGGQVIHDFALAMVVGSIVGTYSTVAIATPLVYEWEIRSGRRPLPPAGAAPGLKPHKAGKQNAGRNS